MSGHLTILGAGESGVGAALLGIKTGWDVFVSDMGKIADDKRDELQQHQVEFEEGRHSEERILSSTLVVKSPGIPDTAPLIQQLQKQATPVISEIEFASRYTEAPIVAITGTNGKTTTTALTHHVLSHCGMDAGVAGNIGISFARLLASEEEKEVYVLEVSSFQLDGIDTFKPHIAVLLNITPDHLDRYNYQLENYVASKFRILMNQDGQNHFITNAEDPIIQEWMASNSIPSQLHLISTERPVGALPNESHTGAGIENNLLHINTLTEPFNMKIQELALQGKHNLFNSMAAGVTARLFELRKELVRDSLMDFDNIEHRLEFVAKVHGITFINDSKATNINSTWYALESADKPLIWIAGGVDKGNDYSELYDLVDGKVKALICLGKDNQKLKEAFAGRIDPIIEVGSADEAVKLAYDLGHQGDTVLLSPACASFDLFSSYEDRGHQFKQAVRRL